MSFVKGWGASYRRSVSAEFFKKFFEIFQNFFSTFLNFFQKLYECPCWVEISLSDPLGMLDAGLRELNAQDSSKYDFSLSDACPIFDLIKQASNTSFDDSQQDKNTEVNSTTQKTFPSKPPFLAVDYLPELFSPEKNRLTNSEVIFTRRKISFCAFSREKCQIAQI